MREQEDRLTTDEMQTWHACKTMGDLVRARVAREITARTGLSDPDYAVLSRLDELGHGVGHLRQQELADLLRWSKSRLSHHLTRMRERGLIDRHAAEVEAGVVIALTPAGWEALTRARPIHARAIRHQLLDRLTPDEARMLRAIGARLEVESS